jgi:flagellar hook protein FlgE
MSFATSLSGLTANQQKLNVIGNNLANINTIGFKASTVNFSDLVSQSVGGTSLNPAQVGLGVTLGSISPNFSAGGFDSSSISTNVALQGNGFFIVGSDEEQSFTRAGNFSFSADGKLITADGLPVQGYTNTDPVTGSIISNGPLSEIVIPPGTLLAGEATTRVQTVSNLNAEATVGQTFATSLEIIDSLGSKHVATITYTNTAPGKWNYDITVPGEDVVGGTAGTPKSLLAAPGSVEFDNSGVLTKVNGVNPPADVTVPGPAWANGSAVTNFVWDIVLPTGSATLSGYSSPSVTTLTSANGSTPGSIDSVTVSKTGEIIASFGAGKTKVVAQLAIATFNNPQGLNKLGANRFGIGSAAGFPNIGAAGTGGRGTVIGNMLEQSNVDIALEFTQMILAQRGYQANAKSITTADEVLTETLQLKR